MTYNIYIEGYNCNGVFLREYIQGYKTLRGLNKSLNNFLEKSKTIILGQVLYTFNGNENKKYSPESYKVLDRFNAKVFFDFWN